MRHMRIYNHPNNNMRIYRASGAITMTTDELPIKFEFAPSKIVEAINLLTDIAVNKDKLHSIPEEDIQTLAYEVIYETCSAIMHTLRNEDKKAAVLSDFIKHSNLKYLIRPLTKPYMH